MCPEFLDDTNTHTLIGNYVIGAGGMFIPSGATVQEFGTTESSLVWIEPSGKFAIYEATSGWMVAADVVASPPEMEPNDASISGELRWWFREDSIGNSPLGQSGASSWDNIQGGDQLQDVNSPGIASGEINGVDAMYFNGANKHFGENGPENWAMDPFKGANKPFTVIIVARPDIMGTQAMWSMSNVAHATNSQLAFHLHSAGGMYLLKRDDTSSTNSQPFNFPDNPYVAGDVACFTFQTSADGTEVQFYRDTVEITAGPSGLISAATSPPDVGIGVLWRPDKDNDFVGMIAEIAVYSSGLQDSDRVKVEQNLMNKWGIS